MNVQHRIIAPQHQDSMDHQTSAAAAPLSGLNEILHFALRRKWFIIASALLGVLIGFGILATSTPVYTAHTRLLIDTRNPDVANTQNDGSVILDTSAIDSQLELIRSPVVLARVARNMKLHEVPDFNGSKKSNADLFWERVWGTFGIASGPSRVLSEEQAQRLATAILVSGVSATRVGRSYIIQISFRTTSQEWAARVVNAVGEAYIEDQLDAKYVSTRRATEWMQDRINELRVQADTAARNVLRYRMENNIVEIGGQGGLLSSQQLASVANQWIEAKSATAGSKVRLDRLIEILDEARDGRMPEATVAEINANPIIARLRSSYVDVAKREADIARRVGREHAQAAALRNEMRGLQESMVTELRRVVETQRSDYEIALARETSLRAAMDELIKLAGATGEAQIPLRELETTAQSFRSLYDTFLNQQAQQNQRVSFPRTEARVISPASTPWVPTEPNANRILLMSLAFGAFAGVGVAFLRERMDRVFRTPAQVERVLGVECLGIIPAIAREGQLQALPAPDDTHILAPDAQRALARIMPHPRNRSERRDLMRYVTDQPFSRFAETLRSVKVSLDLGRLARESQVIAFVSGMPNEGKTTAASNFAALVASAGQSTVLVDLDLRNPSLTRRLAPQATVGLLEVIRGEVDIAQALVYDAITHVHFLPTVMTQKVMNTSEIIASPQMDEVMRALRKRAHYIVVDLPPLAPIVDARAAVNLVDKFLLVIAWGEAKYDVLQQSLKSAQEIQPKILGAVLNKTDVQSLRKYDAYREQYYDNKYYKKYGYEN